jgi:hypothetical protein
MPCITNMGSLNYFMHDISSSWHTIIEASPWLVRQHMRIARVDFSMEWKLAGVLLLERVVCFVESASC